VTEYLLAGRYRLTDRIAAGGMGEVWRGFDQLLNRRVAVKLLPTVRAGDESSLARFRAEARYAASLSHPGIARVYDYGESAEYGGAYLVMELVDGDPLSAILARTGRLPADATLDIVGQAARALDAAHQAGIVHRDIKPGNILIGSGGTAKITDFGIATAVRAAQASHLTETGMVMGTAMYVSPEQATGSPVTASSDIYSLGVVAFECLAGRPPFTANEPLAIAYAHKHDPVPPLPPDVPPPVVELVRAMLAKTPDHRPASAREVADRAGVLREALTIGIPAQPDRRSPRDGRGQTAGTDPIPRADKTRADLPTAHEVAVTRMENQLYNERPPRATSHPANPRRRLVAAGVTMAICALAAGISFFLSSSLVGKTTGDPGHTSLQNATTSGAPTVVSSYPASPTPSQASPTLVTQSPTASVKPRKTSASHPPKKPTPPPSSSAPASSTPSSSPPSSPSSSPSSSTSPTATATPTS
jgi:serine/threonine protein kinase